MDGAADARLALARDGLQFDPRGGDVHGAEGAEVEALGARATMGNEIDLEKTGLRLIPLAEGADGDLVLRAEPGRVIVAPRGG
jgi:hypothetical protein